MVIGYFKDNGCNEEAKWWHVESDGDKMSDGDSEIEEF